MPHSPVDPAPKGSLAVACTDTAILERASQLAASLDYPFLGVAEPKKIREYPVLLMVAEHGLSLVLTGKGAPGPVSAEFVTGKAGYRREHGGGTGQLVAKAIGLQKTRQPLRVLDATAGLGQDAFVLAGLGCEVQMMERCRPVYELLRDGLARAAECPETAPVVDRMTLLPGNSVEVLSAGVDEVDVIYLDPMFPHRGKAALAKKEMQVFRQVVGDDDDAPRLLEAALSAGACRVVVKRPRKAPVIAGPEPTLRIEGKSSRYDIYVQRALPGTGQG
jgi:16S rRNA (guanine1516-N2)-methyltransferase